MVNSRLEEVKERIATIEKIQKDREEGKDGSTSAATTGGVVKRKPSAAGAKKALAPVVVADKKKKAEVKNAPAAAVEQ